MPVRPRQVFAFSGILNRPPGEKGDPALLAVAMRDGARAWWVEPSRGGGYHVKPIPPRRL